jgi:hypothetical protein
LLFRRNTILTALILVCSAALAPEARLCDRNNAVHVLHLPEQSANPMHCAMHAQAYLAGSSIELMAGEYPKILCIRSPQGNAG